MLPSTDAQHIGTSRNDLCGSRMRTILRTLDNEGADFAVIHHPGPSDSSRPLFVLIHPGDLVQLPYAWGSDAEAEAALSFWAHTGSGTLGEMRKALREGHDIALLHRSSSIELAYPEHRMGLEAKLWKAFSPVHSAHTTLFGDDLETAASWMIRAFDIANRPSIHLAGAYSDPKHGCVTAIGEAFLDAMGGDGPARLTVSPFSPPTNGPGLAWRPDGAPVEMVLPAELQALYSKIASKAAQI